MIFSLALFFLPIFAESSSLRSICYYGSWSVYRFGPGHFRVEDIDPKLCTHIVYAFGGIDEKGQVKALDPWNDIGDEWHEGAFTKLQALRKRNPTIKLLFAVGGWNEGSEKYSRVMSNSITRKTFVESALNFIRKNKFDGLDLDWEYPGFRGGKPTDKAIFTLVVKELSAAFQKYNLITSVAVSANALNIAASYDCVNIAKYLSFLNVMTYDLHGYWDLFTGHHTALFQHPSDKPEQIHLNVNNSISAWIKCGVQPSKLNLGLASYGRTFTLTDSARFGIGAPSSGPGLPGSFVSENGFLGYNEICFEQKKNLWKNYFDETQRVPYSVKGNQWVGYDDPNSILQKVQLARTLGLGGMMIWSIETDDFNGTCGLGKYPLLNSVKKGFFEVAKGESKEIRETEDN